MKANQFRQGALRGKAILKVLSVMMIASIGTAVAFSKPSSIGKLHDPGVNVTGVITDTDCGPSHGTKTHGDATCTRLCVKLGADYALAVNKNLYILRGHEQELNEFAGDRVLVRGTVIGAHTIVVESVIPIVVEVACADTANGCDGTR